MQNPSSNNFPSPEFYSVRFDWLIEVAKVSGKGLHLGVALLAMASKQGRPNVKLSRKTMAHFSLSRDAVYDGLRRLEDRQLVQVWRLPGRCPMIILLEGNGQPLQL